MTEQTMAPPLSTDLSTVDTSMPLVADGIYDLRVEKAEIKETAKHDGKFISLDMVTTGPTKSQKGEDLGPGIHIFDNCMLNPTGKGTWDMVKRNVASVVQAAGVQGARLNNFEQWVPQLNGRVLKVKTGFQPKGVRNGQNFRAKNVVLLYVKKEPTGLWDRRGNLPKA